MVIHRAYGQIDRAAVRDGAPLRVVMATEGRKADGLDLRLSGASLDRFRSNPVLGYSHVYWGRDNLPIGRVDPDSVKVDGDRLVGDLIFDEGDPFAMEVARKLREGYLNACSIGFEVTKWEGDKGDYYRGGVAEEWELHELSVVPIPMDDKAVVESGRELAAVRSALGIGDPAELMALLRAALAARDADTPKFATGGVIPAGTPSEATLTSPGWYVATTTNGLPPFSSWTHVPATTAPARAADPDDADTDEDPPDDEEAVRSHICEPLAAELAETIRQAVVAEVNAQLAERTTPLEDAPGDEDDEDDDLIPAAAARGETDTTPDQGIDQEAAHRFLNTLKF